MVNCIVLEYRNSILSRAIILIKDYIDSKNIFISGWIVEAKDQRRMNDERCDSCRCYARYLLVRLVRFGQS